MKSWYCISLCIFVFLLTACQPEPLNQPTTPVTQLTTPSPTKTMTSVALVSLAPSSTATPEFTPTPGIPLPTETLPPTTTSIPAVCSLVLSDRFEVNELIQDAFVFISSDPSPLGSGTDSRRGVHLWGVSSDGFCGGLLAYDGNSTGWLWTPETSPQLWLASSTPLIFPTDQISQFPIPEECLVPEEAPEFWQPCGNFAFSPDGNWLVYNWGENYCCGQRMNAINLQTGEKFAVPGTWLLKYFPDGQMLLEQTETEGRRFVVFDPISRNIQELGSVDFDGAVWNPDETRMLISTRGIGPSGTLWSGVWAYDFLARRHIFADTGLKPLWTDEYSHIIYQRLGYESIDYQIARLEPSEIVLVDANTGEQTVLLSEPGYDYHLCRSENSDLCVWYGDWIRVARIMIASDSYEIDEQAEEDEAKARCRIYANGCTNMLEEGVLNWRTGEFIPWDDLVLPTPEPVPTRRFLSPAPDFSQLPLYQNPGTGASFYLGTDGRTLWCVPPEGMGEPVQWVDDAEFFMYIPENQ